MTSARQQLREDRHLRDAAKALMDADLQNLRADLSAKSIGTRAMDRITTGASDVFDEAKDVASDHKGVLAAIVAAVALWFAREPILDAVFGDNWRG